MEAFCLLPSDEVSRVCRTPRRMCCNLKKKRPSETRDRFLRLPLPLLTGLWAECLRWLPHSWWAVIWLGLENKCLELYYLQFNVSFVVDVTLFFFVNTLFFLRLLLFSRLVCETSLQKKKKNHFEKKCVISFNSKFSCNVFVNIYNTLTFFKEWVTLWTKYEVCFWHM